MNVNAFQVEKPKGPVLYLCVEGLSGAALWACSLPVRRGFVLYLSDKGQALGLKSGTDVAFPRSFFSLLSRKNLSLKIANFCLDILIYDNDII
jgi:hypothetical protein